MKLVITGTRGYYDYVLDDIKNLPEITLSGICKCSKDDNLDNQKNWCGRNGYSANNTIEVTLACLLSREAVDRGITINFKDDLWI